MAIAKTEQWFRCGCMAALALLVGCDLPFFPPAPDGGDSQILSAPLDETAGSDDTGSSDNSGSTGGDEPPVPPSGTIGSLSVIRLSATQVLLQWTESVRNEEGFLIQRFDDAAGWIDFAETPADVTTLGDASVRGDAVFCYRVAAFNAAGTTDYAPQECVLPVAPASPVVPDAAPPVSPDTPRPPATPSSLVVTPVSATEVAIAWADNAANEDGFTVQRCVWGQKWQDYATLPANTTTFVDTAAPSGAYVCFRVRADNAVGSSAYAASKCAWVPQTPVVPTTPDTPTTPAETPVDPAPTPDPPPATDPGVDPPPARDPGVDPPPAPDPGVDPPPVTDPGVDPPSEPVTPPAPVRISGRIHERGVGLVDVRVQATGVSETSRTDAEGLYSITVPAGWTGDVTVQLETCVFTPTDRTYTNVTVDSANQDYAVAPPAPAADTYYIAADGKPENSGTWASPWPSVIHALERVGGGRTIVFQPGRYQGPIEIAPSYSGTPERPTVIRSEHKWQAIVENAPIHGIRSCDNANWIVFDGFQVRQSAFTGIKLSGHYNTIRNCWVHHNTHDGIEAHNRTGSVIEANLVEHNGIDPNYDHGIYADGSGITVARNIVRRNASHGIHLYPSVVQSVIVGNVCHDNPSRQILAACPVGGGQNRIVNNTCVGGLFGIGIWNGNGEIVVNNIAVGNETPLLFQHESTLIVADWNVLGRLPGTGYWGPEIPPGCAGFGTHNTVTADARFVDRDAGVLWLTPESPAIGIAHAEDLPAADFWGRAYTAGTADVGAFPYAATRTASAAAELYDWWLPP